MSQTIAKFLLAIFFLSLLVTLQGEKCDRSKATKRNDIRYYRKNFLFLKKIKINFGISLGRPGSSVGTKNAGASKCPWYWKEHVDQSRKPRSLAVAECKNCIPTNCRQINYTHQVLVKECDQGTGEKVWVWKQQKFPIGFVYIG